MASKTLKMQYMGKIVSRMLARSPSSVNSSMICKRYVKTKIETMPEIAKLLTRTALAYFLASGTLSEPI